MIDGWNKQAEVLMEELSPFAINSSVSRDAFGKALSHAIRHWSVADAYRVGAAIVAERKNAFMPTIAQILDVKPRVDAEYGGVSAIRSLLENELEVLRCQAEIDHPTEEDLFFALDGFLRRRFTRVVEQAYLMGFEQGVRYGGGVSPEQLEVLGKYLIKKSREAGQ